MPTRVRRHGFTLIEIMIVVGIISIVISIAVPAWLRQRRLASQRVCQEQLTKIDGAKLQWAIETRQSGGAVPVWADLVGSDRYLKFQPNCPEGEPYTLGSVNELPTCGATTSNYPNPHTYPEGS
jgi:prepilin-type N-terminal cleavage/methylation domain-containing protein